MPVRDAEPWLLALRNTLRNSVGRAYRIYAVGKKTKLDVKFSDGSRGSMKLDMELVAANARAIQDAVENIAALVTGGHTLASAKEQLYGAAPAAPTAHKPANELLVKAWAGYRLHKLEVDNIAENTWRNDYKSTGDALMAVADATTADDLLDRLSRRWKAGIPQRKRCVQNAASFLRWATSKQGKFILPPDRWSPPPQGELKNYFGKKSAEQVKKESKATFAFSDQQIIDLLDAMPINAAHAKDAESAKRWKFAFQLMATYGLRPAEIHHLSVQQDEDGEFVRCDYVKRTGGGYTPARDLEPFHLEWEKDWELIERLKAGEPLPRPNKSVGTAAMEYLRKKSFFKDVYSQGACTKSFRHSYSKRCHQQYSLIPEEVAKFMGHSVEVHMGEYSDWVTKENRRRSIAFARQRRAEFADVPKASS